MNEKWEGPSDSITITLLDFIAAGIVIVTGPTLQASTGYGAGLIIVPLLALIRLEFVPGLVVFASLGLSSLMTSVGREAINRGTFTPSVSDLSPAC